MILGDERRYDRWAVVKFKRKTTWSLSAGDVVEPGGMVKCDRASSLHSVRKAYRVFTLSASALSYPPSLSADDAYIRP